jgi:periplasmic divalent cation tolerance protein
VDGGVAAQTGERTTVSPMTEAESFLVFTTAESMEQAEEIADALLRRRLAACVQLVGPIRSKYWWKGEMAVASEWMCLIKTTRACLDPLADVIRATHTYDVPEMTATPITHGDAAYLEWLGAETSAG